MTMIESLCYVLTWTGKVIIAIYILDFMRTVKNELKEIRKILEVNKNEQMQI